MDREEIIDKIFWLVAFIICGPVVWTIVAGAVVITFYLVRMILA